MSSLSDNDTPEYAVASGWLVEITGQCTGGGCGSSGHEPSCGMDPIATVEHILELLADEARRQQEADTRAAAPVHPNCMIARRSQ